MGRIRPGQQALIQAGNGLGKEGVARGLVRSLVRPGSHPRGFVLDLLPARASAPCLIMLATGTQAVNLGGGCTLYLHGAFLPLFTATNASGFASVKLSIPPDHALRGGAAYAQGVVLDPMGAFAGLALSAGRKLELGD